MLEAGYVLADFRVSMVVIVYSEANILQTVSETLTGILGCIVTIA